MLVSYPYSVAEVYLKAITKPPEAEFDVWPILAGLMAEDTDVDTQGVGRDKRELGVCDIWSYH